MPPVLKHRSGRWKFALVLGVLGALGLVGGLSWQALQTSDNAVQETTNISSVARGEAQSPASARSRMIEADPAETQLAAKDNAANDWLKALDLADKLTQREKDIIRGQSLNPPATAEEIAALLAKIDPIILLLRQGAAKPGCDWGINARTFDSKFTRLAKLGMLGRIALWDSTQRITNEPDEVVANLKALDQLGNSLQNGLVSGILNATTRSLIVTFVAEQAGQMPAAHLQDLLNNLQQSSFPSALQKALRSEGEYTQASLIAAQSGKKTDGSPLSDEEKTNLRSILGYSPEKAQKISEDYQRLSTNLSESLFWPDDKYRTWLNHFKQTASIPAKSVIFEIYPSTRSDMRQMIAANSMAAAGLAVMDGGVAALPQMLNPLTGKTFGYRVVDKNGSFELQAEANKGMTLTFKMQPRK